ncbi:flagellar brake protein [Alicyclobacillus shizuokensis]|uniref:flagellar brake protein n=1 Tax=Alicyclobacillus shizuokensis TaxID=392014 RepID=UPI0008306D0C|nr:PilZ domain-containing protein [Alicyclobacillus shizuokensis]MCL6625047.1 PilZ domain-containing protein [Alicyclobacillus shizuokensis]
MKPPVVGQWLRIREQPDQPHYLCKLLDLTDTYWLVDNPIPEEGQPPLQLAMHRKVWMEYQGKDGALYTFAGEVIGRKEGALPSWEIRAPRRDEIIRQQRREFLRVPADIPVRLEWTDGEHKRIDDVFTRDISGGGLALLVPRQVRLQPGMIVRVFFALPTNQFAIDAQCHVVRVSDRNEAGYAVASMAFTSIKEAVRQRIIQYTFQRQRALM